MHSRYLGVALALALLFLFADVSVANAQGGAPLGIVISARSGQVGTSVAAPGLTVFSGDRVLTAKDSGLIIRAGKLQFSFQDNTTGILVAQPDGVALDLIAGSVTFSASEAAFGTVFVSDLRIAPHAPMPFAGDVTVAGECSAIVTSYAGELQVLRKAALKSVPAQTSAQITPEFPIEPRPPGVPPGSRDFHAGHAHGACKLPPAFSAKSLGPNWFLPVLFIEAGAATAVVLARPVSPF